MLVQLQFRTYHNIGLLHGLDGFSYSLKSRTRGNPLTLQWHLTSNSLQCS